jgi:hypothetical protein
MSLRPSSTSTWSYGVEAIVDLDVGLTLTAIVEVDVAV